MKSNGHQHQQWILDTNTEIQKYASEGCIIPLFLFSPFSQISVVHRQLWNFAVSYQILIYRSHKAKSGKESERMVYAAACKISH